jgi:hypothetical protein
MDVSQKSKSCVIECFSELKLNVSLFQYDHTRTTKEHTAAL